MQDILKFYEIYSMWKITIKFGYLLRVHQSSMYNAHTLAFYSEKKSLREIDQDQFSKSEYHFNITYDLWNVGNSCCEGPEVWKF